MSFELWLFYCAAALGLSLTPGPNGLLVLSHGMRFGLARAVFLPQFMQPGVSYAVQLMMLGGTFAVVEFFYELLLAAIAQRVSPWLGRNGRAFNRAAGASFVGIGVVLATANRP